MPPLNGVPGNGADAFAPNVVPGTGLLSNVVYGLLEALGTVHRGESFSSQPARVLLLLRVEPVQRLIRELDDPSATSVSSSELPTIT